MVYLLLLFFSFLILLPIIGFIGLYFHILVIPIIIILIPIILSILKEHRKLKENSKNIVPGVWKRDDNYNNNKLSSHEIYKNLTTDEIYFKNNGLCDILYKKIEKDDNGYYTENKYKLINDIPYNVIEDNICIKFENDGTRNFLLFFNHDYDDKICYFILEKTKKTSYKKINYTVSQISSELKKINS